MRPGRLAKAARRHREVEVSWKKTPQKKHGHKLHPTESMNSSVIRGQCFFKISIKIK